MDLVGEHAISDDFRAGLLHGGSVPELVEWLSELV